MGFRKHFGNRRPKVSKEEKYGNTQSTCALGHSHRSKLEGAVCALLQWREKAGELTIMQAEDHVYLTLARIHYIPDWKCLDLKSHDFFWVEAKGFEDPKWPLKKKLWKFYGPGRLEIWKGSYSKPYLDEIVIPQTDIFPEGKK